MKDTPITQIEQIFKFSHYPEKQYTLLPIYDGDILSSIHDIDLSHAWVANAAEDEQKQKVLRGRNGTLKFINLYAESLN